MPAALPSLVLLGDVHGGRPGESPIESSSSALIALGLSRFPARSDALVQRLAALGRRVGGDSSSQVEELVHDLGEGEHAGALVQLVLDEIRRQQRIRWRRAESREPPAQRTIEVRKRELAEQLLGAEELLDVRLEPGLLLALSWRRLLFRFGMCGTTSCAPMPAAESPSGGVGSVSVPQNITTVSDALGWMCLSDVDAATRQGRAFRRWLARRERKLRREGHGLAPAPR